MHMLGVHSHWNVAYTPLARPPQDHDTPDIVNKQHVENVLTAVKQIGGNSGVGSPEVRYTTITFLLTAMYLRACAHNALGGIPEF